MSLTSQAAGPPSYYVPSGAYSSKREGAPADPASHPPIRSDCRRSNEYGHLTVLQHLAPWGPPAVYPDTGFPAGPQMANAALQPAFGHLPAAQNTNAFQPEASTSSAQHFSPSQRRSDPVYPVQPGAAFATQLPPPAVSKPTDAYTARVSAPARASPTSSPDRKVSRASQRPASSKPRYNPLHRAATKNAAASRSAASRGSSCWSLERLFEVPEYSLAPQLKPYVLPAAPEPPSIDASMKSLAVDPFMAPSLTGGQINSPWNAFGANNRGLEEGRKWAEAAAAAEKASLPCIDPSATLSASYLERQTRMPLDQAAGAAEEDTVLSREDLFEPELFQSEASEEEEVSLDEMNYTPVSKLWETHQYTGGPAKMHKSALDISQQVVEEEASDDDECATDRDAFEEDEEEEESEDDDEFDPDLDSDCDD